MPAQSYNDQQCDPPYVPATFLCAFTDVSQTPILNIIIIWFMFCTESVIKGLTNYISEFWVLSSLTRHGALYWNVWERVVLILPIPDVLLWNANLKIFIFVYFGNVVIYE